MYIPKHFEQPSIEAMHELIRAYPLATLVTFGAEGLCADHIPLLLSEKPEPYGLLSGHVPRSEQDKAGVAAGLRGLGISNASQMAELVERGTR